MGAFIIQALVNVVILMITSRMSEGIEFDGLRTTVWAGIALTTLQFVVRLVG